MSARGPQQGRGDASAALFARASRRFPGGSSRTTLGSISPQRYAARGVGSRVFDVDGRELIDLHGDYSALVHGNAFAPVVAAATQALRDGSAFGLPTAHEVELAELLAERVGWAERWRFTGSGSEAVMGAVRAARAVTGREKVLRFACSYHGGWDALAAPGERGVPGVVSAQTIAVPAGDAAAFERALELHGDRTACVLLDPMPNRSGLTAVDGALVSLVRARTRELGIALILDEVITFRLGRGGMHARHGVEGDLIALGKLIGGGLPVGAVGGSRRWMDVFDPGSPDAVPLAGTFAANPVSMAAGVAALRALDGAAIERIDALGESLRAGLRALGCEVGGAGSLCKLRSPESKSIWPTLYEHGVLIAADGLMSVSTVIDEATIATALEGFAQVFGDG
ncbi:MAG TPA: aminotransferase class III-fold pyridoxal phosphate-dependent enzyme [Solirubrobacteraceae bacterium]|jgi:glutamate-1-semialdehyde 2,1-aminomutase|nr:aminotransferase class III-fold pyridoxal phosphate-dependent enzyme [Solirubrobacteraceae bacterium]